MQTGSLLFLIAATVIAYLNSFWGDFQFDDYNVIVDNPSVHSWEQFYEAFFKGIRPFLKLTYTINWTSGAGLFGFHLFNLSAHIANILLLYFMAMKIARKEEILRERHKEYAALICCILFALHPMQTEAVTYISGRSSSLMTLLSLLSLFFYFKGSEDKNLPSIYVLSPFFYGLAVMVKESAMFLPLILVLYDALYARSGISSAIKRQAIHWLLFTLITLTVLSNNQYYLMLHDSINSRNIIDNADLVIKGIFYNLSKYPLLTGQNIDPLLQDLHNGNLLYPTAIALSVIAAVASIKQQRWFAFAVGWFFAALFIYLIIPRTDVLNERTMYPAMIGPFLAVALILTRLSAMFSPKYALAKLLALLLIITLGSLTYQRNKVYYNEIALWQDAIEKSPHNHRAFINLGYAYHLKGMHKESAIAHKEGLRLRKLQDPLAK